MKGKFSMATRHSTMISALLVLACVVLFSACSDVVRPGGLKSLYGTPAPGAPGGSHGKSSSIKQSSPTYYIDLARKDALDAGIDPDAFERQIRQESGFSPTARGGSGEIGIAQLMPDTAAGLGIDRTDPAASLRGAAQIMGRFYRKYGDYRMAAAAYNAGSGTLAAAVRDCGGSWESCLPRSTRAYIRVVMGG